MPRKFMVLVVVALMLVAACSSDPDPAPVVQEPDSQDENPPVVADPGNTEGPPTVTVVWETSTYRSSSPELLDGQLVFFGSDRIYSIDSGTGDLAWDYSLSKDGLELRDDGYDLKLFIYHEDKGAITYVLHGEEDYSLEHLDISTGERLWRTPFPNTSEYNVEYYWKQGDLIFARSSCPNNITIVLRVQDGVPIPFSSQTTVNSFENCFYAFPGIPAGQSAAFTFAKYDLTGEKLWETELDTQGEDYSGAFVSRLTDGTVLHNLSRVEGGKTSYRVYALDEGDGTVLWAKEGNIGDMMTVDNQAVYYLLNDNNASLLDPVTGQVVTEFVMDGTWVSSSDNTVCISGDDSLKALDVKTGTIQWEKSIGDFSFLHEESGILWGWTSLEFASDARPENKLYAIKMDTGQILTTVDYWGEQGGVGTPMHLQVIEAAGKSYIYLGAIMSSDGGENLAVFDAATGDQLWEIPAHNRRLITDQEGNMSFLFFGTDSLKKIDLPTGEVVWEYQVPEDKEYQVSLIEEPYIVLSIKESDEESILICLDYDSGDELYRFTAEGTPRYIIDGDVITFEDRRVRRIAPPQP